MPATQRKNPRRPWTFSVPLPLVERLGARIQSLGMSRSEYLRHLIRQDYQKNGESPKPT